MIARRQFLQMTAATLAALPAARLLAGEDTTGTPEDAGFAEALATLERASGGRLGVCLLDSASGRQWGRRVDERFPMCSTFKFPLAAAVLARVERGELKLDQRVAIRREDMLAHAPVTEKHVGGHLSVGELCQATMIWSDNPAANLLLPHVGGPAGVTAFLRASGDAVTRNDRNEPEVNRFSPDDPRDTTSPAAMAGSLRRLVLGEVLGADSRRRLAGWLIGNRTGDHRLRAGLPAGWKVGDKTGSNGEDTTNDIAIVWPDRGRAPWLLTSYLQGAKVDADARDDVLRRVGAAAARFIA
ncbi:class A beta-lactamase [Pseudoxanthomonas beigongshangi]